MTTVLDFLQEQGFIYSDFSMKNFDSQDLEEIIIKYSETVIDSYEQKLNEYDGSVTYSQISNELKSEL